MDEKIASMYAKQKRSYFGRYGMDVFKTAISVIALIALIMGTSFDAFIKDAKASWKDNKCNPVYMPFAGTIAPQMGQTAFETTTQNFNYCIQTEVSAAIKIILMPLEFINFLILTSLDLLIQALIEMMKLFAYLANMMKKSGVDINQKLGAFVIPIVVIFAKMRDAFARTSALMLTAVYSVFTIYNIMVSALLNIMTVVLNLLIGMALLIAGMLATGIILYAFVFTAPAGIALMVAATLLLVIVFTPVLVLYILLLNFMMDTFGAKAAPAPAFSF